MVKSSATERLGLDAVTDIAILKSHWKRIRPQVRAPRVQAFYLAADPLEWLPFEYRLDQELNALSEAVSKGEYRAGRPEVVRSAKSLGLTRPLAFLSPIDTLLYRSIVSRAEVNLLQVMPVWSRFGRTDTKHGVEDREPESGWFRAWLARTGQLWAITEEYDWLVETDVSNFFPSVHLDAALDHLLAHTRLGVDTIRLLSHMLREFSPLNEYRVSPVGGLPQESFDCSRIIAHSFLQPVDEQFQAEGQTQRYSRYMDDIVVGVQTRTEGFEAVARAQRALETVGLYPNASKTRIIRKTAFAWDYMKDENDYLGRIGTQIIEATVDRADFRHHLKQHLRLNERPRAWERVLRRYYTTSRVLRDQTLIARIPEHLMGFPGSSRQILDYLSTFQMTQRRIEGVKSAIDEMGSLYEDVQLLAMQYAAIAPSNVSELTRRAVCGWARSVIDACHPAQPRLAASAVVVLAKHAKNEEAEYLGDILNKNCQADGGLMRRQLALALLGLGVVRIDWVKSLAVESNEARLMADFLTAVELGDNRAVNLVLSAVAPRERRDPLMFIIPPRPLFLAPKALEALGKHADKRQALWARKLRTSVGPRDRIGEKWLGV